jgi:hypothetical protein
MTDTEWTPSVLTLDDVDFYLGEYQPDGAGTLRVRFHPQEAVRIIEHFTSDPMWTAVIEQTQITMTNLDLPVGDGDRVYAADEDGWFSLGAGEWPWRAVEFTGQVQDTLPYDTESSASRQHNIDTGIYLLRGEVDEAPSPASNAPAEPGETLTERQINTLFVVGQHQPVSAHDVAMHLLSTASAELGRLNRLAVRGLVDRQYTGLKYGDRIGWNLTDKGRLALDQADIDDDYDPLEDGSGEGGQS